MNYFIKELPLVRSRWCQNWGFGTMLLLLSGSSHAGYCLEKWWTIIVLPLLVLP